MLDILFTISNIYWTLVFLYIFGYTMFRLFRAIKQAYKIYRSKKCCSEHQQSEFNFKLYSKYIWNIVFPFLEGHKAEKRSKK